MREPIINKGLDPWCFIAVDCLFYFRFKRVVRELDLIDIHQLLLARLQFISDVFDQGLVLPALVYE